MHPQQTSHPTTDTDCGDRIPVIKIDKSITPPTHRIEALEKFCSPLHEMTLAGAVGENTRIDAMAAWLSDCILTRVSGCEMHFARTDRQLKMECCGHLRLRMYLEGRSVGILGEDRFDLSAGGIQIFDFSRPHRAVKTDCETIAVIVPHAAVGYDPAQHPGQFNFSLKSAWGRVLEEGTLSLFNRLPNVRQTEAGKLAENYCALIRGVIHQEHSGEEALGEIGRVRNAAILRFIDNNLDNPELGATDVCVAFGMSRATIYRDFEPLGGIARYITRRRLEEAMRDLARSQSSRGLIKRVSARWGFYDPSHFNRLFRAQFGFSPSEFIGIGDGQAAALNDGESGGDRIQVQVPDLSSWLKCPVRECPVDKGSPQADSYR